MQRVPHAQHAAKTGLRTGVVRKTLQTAGLQHFQHADKRVKHTGLRTGSEAKHTGSYRGCDLLVVVVAVVVVVVVVVVAADKHSNPSNLAFQVLYCGALRALALFLVEFPGVFC